MSYIEWTRAKSLQETQGVIQLAANPMIGLRGPQPISPLAIRAMNSTPALSGTKHRGKS